MAGYTPMRAPWGPNVPAPGARGRGMSPLVQPGRAPGVSLMRDGMNRLQTSQEPQLQQQAPEPKVSISLEEAERLISAAAAPAGDAGVPTMADRTAALDRLRAAVAEGEVLGLPKHPKGALSAEFHSRAFSVMQLAWEACPPDPARGAATSEFLESAYRALEALTQWAAFSAKELPSKFLSDFFKRIHQLQRASEQTHLRYLLYWAYLTFEHQRKVLRRQIGGVLQLTGAAVEVAPLRMVLEVTACICSGMLHAQPRGSSLGDLLTELLLPLYKIKGTIPNSDPPQPALGMLQPALSRCVVEILRREQSSAPHAAAALVAAWPTSADAASTKALLLLDELEEVIAAAGAAFAGDALVTGGPALLVSLDGDHAASAARAANLIASPRLEGALKAKADWAVSRLIPALAGTGEAHWSASVNASRYRALVAIQGLDPGRFAEATSEALARSGGGDPAPAVQRALPQQQQQRKKRAATPFELLALLKPEATPSGDGDAAAMALSPTLLPDLGYQDLVFAFDLGSGAFSTVKAARAIIRGQPQSAWPTYAVKCVSADTIRRHHYESNVAREIAALRSLSHPGIARLISSFRWRGDVFLVLEFAAQGDLQGLLASRGTLAEASARFIFAEVAAALSAVHGAGLAFGDLKAENVLLTASGHAKVTDFGAVRPISPHGAEICRGAKAVLGALRDGDWRAKAEKAEKEKAAAAAAAAAANSAAAAAAKAADGAACRDAGQAEASASAPSAGVPGADAHRGSSKKGDNGADGCAPESAAAVGPSVRGEGDVGAGDSAGVSADAEAGAGTGVGAGAGGEEEEESDEERLEGTVAYLAPEVVLGITGTTAEADCWALGCLLYMMLAGKPPLWSERQETLLSLIADFTALDTAAVSAAVPCKAAAALLGRLLVPSPKTRATIAQVAADPWLEGLDLQSVHSQTPPPLSGGATSAAAVVAAGGATRRLNSVLWSRKLGGNAPLVGARGVYGLGIIPESQAEAGAPFLRSAALR